MEEKKQLNEEQLEKVSGGCTYNYSNCLSGELSTNDAYQHKGEKLFFFDPKDHGLIYGKLDNVWEDEKFFGAWSYTQYDVTIEESNVSNQGSFGPGCKQTLSSGSFKVYTNCSGPRPIRYY